MGQGWQGNGERGRPAHADVLTPAEWRVVEAVRHGLSNPEIARRQGVSLDAIKYHVANAPPETRFFQPDRAAPLDGIRRDSRLFTQEQTMTTALALGPIGQIARSVKDIAAARAWYGDVLGLDPLYSFGNLAFFNCGGLRLLLSEGEGGQRTRSSISGWTTSGRPRDPVRQGHRVRQCAASHPQARRRHRGMDGLLQGQ